MIPPTIDSLRLLTAAYTTHISFIQRAVARNFVPAGQRKMSRLEARCLHAQTEVARRLPNFRAQTARARKGSWRAMESGLLGPFRSPRLS